MTEVSMTPGVSRSAEAADGPGAAAAPGRIDLQIEQALRKAVNWFLSNQDPKGYWWGELEADTTLESDYIFYLHILGQPESEKIPKLAKYIRARQLPDGGWNIFVGGPAELNATVKAWVALRLAGDSASSEHLERAKKRIHELGGLEATNSYVRFYLAMVGAIPWSYAPAIPPEVMLLPSWFPVN